MHFHRDPYWAIGAIILAAVARHFFLRWFVKQNNISTVGHVLSWVAFAIVAVIFMHLVRVF